MANTNIQFYTDTRTVFSTSDGQGKTSIGSANGTVQGLEIEYDLLTPTPEAFKIISPLGVNYTRGITGATGAINYTTPLDRTAQVGSLIQSLKTPPDATTLQVDKRILLTDGVSNGSIEISGVNTQVTSSGNVILNPVGNVDLSGNNLHMGGGDIIDCPLIQSVNNNNIIVEGRGTGDIILKTNSVNRLTISETGAMTFHGGMEYDNANDTLTATRFNGTVTKASLANNNTSGTFYPVFATGAGSQSLFVDDDTLPFSINPNNGIIRLYNIMKIQDSRIGFGSNAGLTTQQVNTVAIGNSAGRLNQELNCVAIGNQAGQKNQGAAITFGSQDGSAVAIGNQAGRGMTRLQQQPRAVAIGPLAGDDQEENCVAIGNQAGNTTQRDSAVAIGNEAGKNNQRDNAIAIGNLAGINFSQPAGSICINASGDDLDPNLVGLFIKPIRSSGVGSYILMYTPSSGEITYTKPNT